jgi:hypothetical protein
MKQKMKTINKGNMCIAVCCEKVLKQRALEATPFFNGIKIGLMQLYFTVKALPFEMASCETFALEN